MIGIIINYSCQGQLSRISWWRDRWGAILQALKREIKKESGCEDIEIVDEAGRCIMKIYSEWRGETELINYRRFL